MKFPSLISCPFHLGFIAFAISYTGSFQVSHAQSKGKDLEVHSNPSSWLGVYEYEEKVGAKNQKHKLPWIYTLSLREAKNPKCFFQINGLKIKEWAHCREQVDSDSLKIYFIKYDSQSYGNRLNKKAHLFTLYKDPVGELHTKWVDLKPNRAGPMEGRFFKLLPLNQHDSE